MKPKIQYTVQQPLRDAAGDLIALGYVQIDLIEDGINTRSTSIEALRDEGMFVPSVPFDLPTGQYSLGEVEAAWFAPERSAAS